jgi:hypothetical protein
MQKEKEVCILTCALMSLLIAWVGFDFSYGSVSPLIVWVAFVPMCRGSAPVCRGLGSLLCVYWLLQSGALRRLGSLQCMCWLLQSEALRELGSLLCVCWLLPSGALRLCWRCLHRACGRELRGEVGNAAYVCSRSWWWRSRACERSWWRRSRPLVCS